MNRPELWLHVGLPKTSTTSFQSWMRENAEGLKDDGIIYPPIYGQQNDKHDFLVRALRHEPQLSVLTSLLEDSGNEKILLSDEGLSNHLDDFDPNALTRFRELTRRWAVKIILVTREADSWTRSYHKQCVINPNNGASPLWGTGLTLEDIRHHPRIQRLLDEKTLVEDLKTAFGADSLHLYQHEDPKWFHDCLDQIGAARFEAVALPRSNESLPDWSIEFLRQVNVMTDERPIRNAWKIALQHYLRSNHTILTNLSIEKSGGLDEGVLTSMRAQVDNFPAEYQMMARRFLDHLG